MLVGKEERLAPERLDLRRDLSQALLGARSERDVGALACERQRGFTSDPGPDAGHDDGLALEQHQPAVFGGAAPPCKPAWNHDAWIVRAANRQPSGVRRSTSS